MKKSQTVYIDSEIMEQVTKAAAIEGRSVNQYMVRALKTTAAKTMNSAAGRKAVASGQ